MALILGLVSCSGGEDDDLSGPGGGGFGQGGSGAGGSISDSGRANSNAGSGGAASNTGGVTAGPAGAGGSTGAGTGGRNGSNGGIGGGATNGGSTGMGGTGGRPAGSAGNAAGTGGRPPGTGGTAGAGGSSAGTGGVPMSGCTEPQGQVCDNLIGNHCGYTFEYWKDSGDGCMTNKADGFSVEWDNINNLLGRKGLRPGSTNQIVTYEANYLPNGNSYLCVYGWSRDPLIEYYVVDSWGTIRPPGSQPLGTVSSDGGTYDIYRTQRVNQPSIDGTRTFYQYWSVRRQKRTSGTITVGNHFQAWAGEGMNLGTLYEVSMTVEGYQSSGRADVKMSMR